MSTELTLDGEVLLTWVTLVVAVISAVFVTSRWIIKTLDNRILEATKPIHPHGNGGVSLPDLHRKVDALGKEIDVRLTALETEGHILRYRLSVHDGHLGIHTGEGPHDHSG